MNAPVKSLAVAVALSTVVMSGAGLESLRRFSPGSTPAPAQSLPAPLRKGTLPAGALSLPLYFEENRGQADPHTRFLAQGLAYRLELQPGGAALYSQSDARQRLKLIFESANPQASLSGESHSAEVAHSNYLLGSDSEKWLRDLPNFDRVRYHDVWPGIDVVFYGNGSTLEYDFVVAPGADLAKARIRFLGASKVASEADGSLSVQVNGTKLVQRAPLVYQIVGDVRHNIPAHYTRLGSNLFGFDVKNYDASRALIVDPVLDYSTYLGGAREDYPYGVGVDSSGNIYIAGQTNSPGLASTGAYQSTLASGDTNAFVMKLDPSGMRRIYTTYLGGPRDDIPYSLAVSASGEPHLAGVTVSGAAFPRRIGGSDPWINTGLRDGLIYGFVTKLNANGDGLVYSYIIGGSRMVSITRSPTAWPLIPQEMPVWWAAPLRSTSRWSARCSSI